MIHAADKQLEENLKKRDEARNDMKSRRPADPVVVVDATEEALIDQDIPVETGVRPDGQSG